MYQLLCLIVVSFALIKTGGYQIDIIEPLISLLQKLKHV